MMRTDKFSRERNGNEFVIHIQYYESFDMYEYHICLKDDEIEDALVSGGYFEHSRFAYEEAQSCFEDHAILLRELKRREGEE